MSSLAIIPAMDILENILLSLFPAYVLPIVNQLLFQGRKKLSITALS
jgi:hypothetical protein